MYVAEYWMCIINHWENKRLKFQTIIRSLTIMTEYSLQTKLLDLISCIYFIYTLIWKYILSEWGRTLLSTRTNITCITLSVTYGRSLFFSGYSGFFHQKNYIKVYIKYIQDIKSNSFQLSGSFLLFQSFENLSENH
jgi:hypothetical protein